MQDRKGGSDHCIGLIWSEGGSISLYDYLADCCKPYADKFTYYVNGSPCEGTLELGDEPDKYHPTVFHVELRDEEGDETLDRMWIVVNSPKAQDEFDKWYGDNADTKGITSTSTLNGVPSFTRKESRNDNQNDFGIVCVRSSCSVFASW